MFLISMFPTGQIKAIYFSGSGKKDVAWFHEKSGTLIVADLIFNLPANEQYSKFKQRETGFLANKQREAGFLTKKLNPSTNFHKNFIWCESKHKACVSRVSSRSCTNFYLFIHIGSPQCDG